MQTRWKRLLLLAGLAGLCFPGCRSLPAPVRHDSRPGFWVAPNGNDANPGTRLQPFRTLERARAAVRRLKARGPLPPGGVLVRVRPGRYDLPRALALDARDSGTAGAPIEWAAVPAGRACLSAGRVVPRFTPVRDAAVLARLDPAVRKRVVQANLRALGITEYGSAGGGGLYLYFRGRPMTVARWPNHGFTRIVKVVGGKRFNVRGTWGDHVGKFVYQGDRPKRWLHENDLWLHGYWFWDWSDQREPVAEIDPSRHVITLAKPYHHYGYRKGQWYYAFNALSELDSPGEWYLDRKSGILYFLPPAPIRPGDAVVSVRPKVLTMDKTAYVTFRGFTIEASRDTPVQLRGCDHCRIEACLIRCTGRGAVSIHGGRDSGVVGCDITATAKGGVSLYGGNRKTLTPARLYADNNHIHHYSYWWRMYGPAIGIGGVGNRAAHNLIDNAPHCAILFGGNDHRIEYNEIHSVCYEANDAGAIYAGRDWTMRGTVIRDNYLHHINGFRGRGCVGVYLDDMFCGATIADNVFYKVTRAAFIGGGRDNIIENNLFLDCPRAIHMDARGLGWARGSVPTTMVARLKAMPYTSALWRKRYPKLVDILQDDPAAPKGDIIRRNIAVGRRWNDIDARARTFVHLENNLFGAPRSIFTDPAHPERHGFRLRPGGPAAAIHFQPIPFDKIGPVNDGTRASWPVVSKVRPLPEPPKRPRRPRRGKAAVYRLHRVRRPPTIDGRIAPGEWREAGRPMPIRQGVRGENTTPPSTAWLECDGRTLYVAVAVPVPPHPPLRIGKQWGKDDAVELAFQVPGRKPGPILILRGYASGFFESSDEAGAPARAVRRAARGVRFAATVLGPKEWTCEWAVPLRSLGIDPKKNRRIAFNVSVRKTAASLWQMWQGTRDYTWAVDRAGFLEFPEH